MSGINKLLDINVNDKTEKKGQLTYLSWAWAWAEFIKVFPQATYQVKFFDRDGVSLPYTYQEGVGYMVFTEVTVDEQTKIMWLPVMDNRNQSMQTPKMTDINKTLMRCLTKNLAMFGLGLYIYAGEDLPEEAKEEQDKARIEDLGKKMLELKTMDGLKKFWAKLNSDERSKLEDIKNEVKAKLEA